MQNRQEYSWENSIGLYSSSVPSPALAEIPCIIDVLFPLAAHFLIISIRIDSIYSAWLLAVFSAVQ